MVKPKNEQPVEDAPKASFSFPKMEEDVLAFWQKEKIFERSVEERPASKAYVFYDGPPYATGAPHIGGLLCSIIKDLVPRYQTMKDHRVERRFGWDCHGLPVEVMVEKELGLKAKRDVEEFGIGKFNEACRGAVMRYVDVWRKTITRFGRWVDFDNDYKTMDPTYMESAWWVFGELHKKGLVYEGYRCSLYCTRCETPLSNFETAMDNSYKEVTDPAVSIAFQNSTDKNLFFLAWTTTPWTLSANVALAVNEEASYVEVELTSGNACWVGRHLILAEARATEILGEGNYKIIKKMIGADLVGERYGQLQSIFTPDIPEQAFRVVAAPFVTLTDGTGIVHIAPAFGEDDFNLSKTEGLPVLLTVDAGGKFTAGPWAGQHVKAADASIVEALRAEEKLFKVDTVTHSYPFCWRCASPLIYKVQNSWYVKVEALKKKLQETNEPIRWVPEHLKAGRFGMGLESAPDWCVSRSRFWGIPLPVWRCDRCEKERVISNLDELEAASGKRPADLHRPMIDEVAWACACGGTFTRITDVFDVWFDSGVMPYGQQHYPMENEERFTQTFPADFITEYIPQTRGWFYVMHVLSTALFGKPAFKNVVATGTILAADGTKMSKSKGNFPNTDEILNKYGSDAMRLYLVSSALMRGEDVNYEEEAIVDSLRKVLLPLGNVLSFYALYQDKKGNVAASSNVLDEWVLSRLEQVRQEVESGMENYELWRAVRPLVPFIADLSNWYLRRSRDRFKGEDEADRAAAIETLSTVLVVFAKIIAPFAPFFAEHMYQQLKGYGLVSLDSVHLELWPEAVTKLDEALLTNMEQARRVIELGHALRSEQKLKVRQPLATVWVKGVHVADELQELVIDELNVKTFSNDEAPSGENIATLIDPSGAVSVSFDMMLTPELKREGLGREFVRQVNALRKNIGLTINDQVSITYATNSERLQELLDADAASLVREVLATHIVPGEGEHEIKVEGEIISVRLTK